MQHLDEGTIHAWLDGALDDDERTRVESHVAECAECAALAAEARGLIAGTSRVLSALDATPGDVIPATRERKAPITWRQRRPWLTPALAAAAAVAFVAVGTTMVVKNSDMSKQATVASAPGERVMMVRPPAAADSTRVTTTPSPSVAAMQAPTSAKVAAREPARVGRAASAADVAVEQRADSAVAGGRARGFEPTRATASTMQEANRAAQGVVAAAPPTASAPAAATERRMMTVRDAEKSAARALAPGAAPAPMAARPELQGQFAGCYTIVSGDALGFPTRFVLDSVRVETDAIGERYAMRALGQSTPSGTSWIAMGPVARASWATREGQVVLELRVGGTEPFTATVSRNETTHQVTLKRC